MVFAQNVLLGLALCADDAPVTITLDAPATTCFEPQNVAAHVTNSGDAELTGALTLSFGLPAGNAERTAVALTVPAHGEVSVDLPYELYEPGDYTFNVSAVVDDQTVATYSVDVAVPEPDNVPWLFPNYYGQYIRRGRGPRARLDRRPKAGEVVQRSMDIRPTVNIDDQGRLVREGKPWFPIGIYTAPNTSAEAKELVDAGFDLTSIHAGAGQQLRAALDTLHRWGLNAWIAAGDWLDFSTSDVDHKKEQLTNLVKAVSYHPGLAFWESVDEPAWNGVSATGLRAGYQFLRAQDINHPIWINHACRNRLETLAYYNQGADMVGVDIYPIPEPQQQSDQPNKQISVVADELAKNIAAVNAEKPVLMVLQAFSWSVEDPTGATPPTFPTLAQSRYMAYEAIVGGAAGILYWGTHTLAADEPFWGVLKTMACELRALAPLLAAPKDKAPNVSPMGSPIHALHKVLRNKRTVFLVNRSDEPAKARVSVPGAKGPWTLACGDGDIEPLGFVFEITLPAWGACCVTEDPKFQPAVTDFTAQPIAAPAAAPTEEGNALRNPSFAADADGVPLDWEAEWVNSALCDTETPHSGAQCLRLDSHGAEGEPWVGQDAIAVEADTKYILSGWTRSDFISISARAYAEWETDNGFHRFETDYAKATEEWQPFALQIDTHDCPDGELYVVLQVKGDGHVWFDDLKLAPGELPAPEAKSDEQA